MPWYWRAIPTRVGKSKDRDASGSLFSGHPHAGGEIHPRKVRRVVAVGPSPRGWGNHGDDAIREPNVRAIPTRVGKSRGRSTLTSSTTGHPHAGGEIPHPRIPHCTCDGPSPRGWGNLRHLRRSDAERRAIPTRVGKSTASDGTATTPAGHPHAGGEIPHPRIPHCTCDGPSPRGWGNLPPILALFSKVRAIPTRVGKSSFPACIHLPRPGHPHAGGEIFLYWLFAAHSAGPSPRGWGNHRFLRMWADDIRAIPTRVGKSARRSRSSAIFAGHPHAGGEITEGLMPIGCDGGPSPRGWGNPEADLFGELDVRAIPTRVGKSRVVY